MLRQCAWLPLLTTDKESSAGEGETYCCMEGLVQEVGLQCSAAGAQAVCVCARVYMSVYVIVLTSYSLFLAWDISLSPLCYIQLISYTYSIPPRVLC